MLSALYGVWAARLGDRDLSSMLFEKGFGEFIQEPFMEVDEYSDSFKPDYPRVGPFFANLGGFLSSCLYGLGRMIPAACFGQAGDSRLAICLRTLSSNRLMPSCRPTVE